MLLKPVYDVMYTTTLGRWLLDDSHAATQLCGVQHQEGLCNLGLVQEPV
jgi:hypothetical protein